MAECGADKQNLAANEQGSCCSSKAQKPEQTKTAEPKPASSCCSSKTSTPATKSASCCSSEPANSVSADLSAGCCGAEQKQSIDWIFWICLPLVIVGYLSFLVLDYSAHNHLEHQAAAAVEVVKVAADLSIWQTLRHTAFEMVNAMWWGIISASIFVGLLGRVPRELIMSLLGRGGSKRGLVRSTLAGLLLDLCNHGILMVAMKLYERGASLGQVMAFLIASPWNSLTLTLILIGLIGLPLTLLFIAGSMVIALVSGWIFERLVAREVLPANPYQGEYMKQPFWPTLKQSWQGEDWSARAWAAMFWQGLKESRMVLRWVLFGIVLVALIRAFVPPESFGVWFGATAGGLFLTLLATTLIEVCSEGSSPIAADLVNRAGAPGNAFTFLMAGAATDYTEIMALKDTTKSLKIALFLPLVTVPQVLLIGWLMNTL